jgi:hypothetical protein
MWVRLGGGDFGGTRPVALPLNTWALGSLEGWLAALGFLMDVPWVPRALPSSQMAHFRQLF